MRDTDTEWQVSEDFDVLWEAWDDENLAYHSGSGQTHLLNALATCVLQVLQHHSGNFSYVFSELADRVEGELDEGLCQQVRELLEQFESLGLIEVPLR